MSFGDKLRTIQSDALEKNNKAEKVEAEKKAWLEANPIEDDSVKSALIHFESQCEVVSKHGRNIYNDYLKTRHDSTSSSGRDYSYWQDKIFRSAHWSEDKIYRVKNGILDKYKNFGFKTLSVEVETAIMSFQGYHKPFIGKSYLRDIPEKVYKIRISVSW